MLGTRGVGAHQNRIWTGFFFATAFLVAFFVVFFATPALAQINLISEGAEIPSALNVSASTDLRAIIVRVVQFFLGFLGLIAVIVIMYGGFLWMTSRGNPQQVEQAKAVLRNGLIGLVIILASWAIVAFVARWFGIGLNGNGNPQQGPPGTCINCFALGGGIIEDHYPERNAVDVPRGASVLITFREAILVDPNNAGRSFILNPKAGPTNPSYATFPPTVQDTTCGTWWCGDINPATFSLIWTDAVPAPYTHLGRVTTNNERQFQIRPSVLMGNSVADTHYQASVKGRPPGLTSNGLTKKNGDAGMSVDYNWDFTVSNVIDITPPQIDRVLPVDDDIYPRDSAIIITFNEPISPISASGDSETGFQNIVVENITNTQPIAGTFTMGNGYRTVTFLTHEFCGKNACGEDKFCLPPLKDIRVTVKAATLWDSPACLVPDPKPLDSAALACSPSPSGPSYDGVVDVSDNSLDGQRKENSSGVLQLPSGDQPPALPKADGPTIDNFTWTFKTSDVIVTTGPVIVQNTNTAAAGVSPVPDSGGAGVSTPLTARFNRSMIPLAAFKDPNDPTAKPIPPVKIGLPFEDVNGVPTPIGDYDSSRPAATPFGPVWVRNDEVKICSLTNGPCEKNNDCPGAGGLNFCGQEDVSIHHGDFVESTEYESRIGSGIKDFTQNCFLPSIGPVGPVAPNSVYSPQPNPANSSTWLDQVY